MTIFWALVLTVVTFGFIAYPLFKRRLGSGVSVEDEKFRELYSKRDTTYAMLKELEFDFQSGILTEEDYLDLEARYKRKAISILRDADDLEKGSEAEDEIEKQVQELRQGKGRFCTQCGKVFREGDRFCSRCGTNLNRGDDDD